MRGGVAALSGYTQQDYEAIEAAVLESPRGRWFLAEFTRRNRAADTLMLLEAIRKLERGVAESSPHQVSDELAAELQSLSDAIGSTLAGDAGEVTEDQVLSAVEQLALVKRQIDGLLSDRSGDNASGALAGENFKFFEGDEGMFETAAAPGPASTPSLMVVGEGQGRTRTARNQAMQDPPGSRPASAPKDRIVFIRRASSNEMAIPLADEAADQVAGRSQPGS